MSAVGTSAAPAGRRALADDAARAAALLDSHRTLLVEAGAGSGKTSLMAGRVALLLAAGAAPRSIAAITFTELAAADLAARIRSFVTRLLAGDVPPELTLVLPHGLDADARERLARAEASLDDLTSTTIHGFCRDLVRPYPVEADVDPGARVLDALESELLFDDVRERWLRQRLADGARGPVAAMVAVDLKQTLRLVEETVALVRAHREVRAPTGGDVVDAWRAFAAAVADVEAAIGPAAPTEALPFRDAARTLRDHLAPHTADPAALSLAALTLPDTYLRVMRDGAPAFRRYRTKSAWTRVDRAHGAALHARGEAAVDALEAAEAHLCGCAAARAMQALLVDLADLRAAYADAKRAAAALDFDDLLLTADRLLREHPRVRAAAANRYRHVLVDEFQDTDPLQATVLWHLCGDPPDGDVSAEPLTWRLRPGALFVVGDPKQSIYRFRGADVDAYRGARAAIEAADPEGVLSVRTNFRSLPAILAYANERFAEPLSRPGQSGFEPLSPWREGGPGPCVLRLPVRAAPDLPDAPSTPGTPERRDLEAAAVADAIATLLGHFPLASRGGRPCEPGDVALLAPTGSDLWRFERALEERGIAVATQAGKGFYQRQEVQDLIALVRTLADERDTLALGALLRGPLVGCSDEQLLDVAERLAPLPWPQRTLTVTTDPGAVGDELVARVLTDLQALRARSREVTPYRVVTEGLARLRVRAVLRSRHGGRAERAWANVELLLEQARAFDERGLAAFARELRRRWDDEEKAVEGRPDVARDALTLITVHSSKGLEWPVVIPVNTFGDVRAARAPVVDRRDGTLHARVLGTGYPALREALEREGEAEGRERARLWYVAATRAQDLLVVPTPAFPSEASWWWRVVDLAADTLPELATRAAAIPGAPAATAASPEPESPQSAADLAAERVTIERATRRLTWQSPSRSAHDEALPVEPPRPRDEEADDRVDAGTWPVPAPLARGRVLHALLQEVLAGILPETARAIAERAKVLTARLGIEEGAGGAGLDPERLVGDVERALAVPAVAARRGRLVPEWPVYAYDEAPHEATVTVGIADAVAYDEHGAPELVVDWKSDLEPTAERMASYRTQVARYVQMLGAARGLIVLLTTGEVIEVEPP